MKSFVVSILIFLSLSSFSQTSKPENISAGAQHYTSGYNNATLYSYSIGFKFLSVEAFPKILDQTDPDALRTSKFNGIILKYNDKQISYRLSGNFFSLHLSFTNRSEEYNPLRGRLTDNHIKVGFEKNIIYSSVQPYFGFDLGVKRSVFKGDAYSRATDRQIAASPYDVKTEKDGLSLSPVLGVKLNLVNHFTVAAEGTFDVLYSRERREENNGGNSVKDKHRWEYLIKPLGMLSLQYNFGEIN